MNLPNKLTILRIIMIPVFMIFALPLPEYLIQYSFFDTFNNLIQNYGMYISGGIFTLAAFTDLLDGKIARDQNIITDFGKFLDPIADKLLVAAALIVLVQIDYISGWIILIVLTREFLVTGIRLMASLKGEVIAASKWGKIKTASQMFALVLIFFDNFPFIYITDLNIGLYFLYFSVIATMFSGYDYIKKNISLITSK